MATFKLWLKKQWRSPNFSQLLKSRKIVLLIVAVVIVHLVLTRIDIEFWHCPVKAVTGFSCPGCGMSQAIIYLVQGEWYLSIREHLFAPVFVLGILVMTGILFLPVELFKKVTGKVELFERKTSFFNMIMTALVIYWLVRLFI